MSCKQHPPKPPSPHVRITTLLGDTIQPPAAALTVLTRTQLSAQVVSSWSGDDNLDCLVQTFPRTVRNRLVCRNRQAGKKAVPPYDKFSPHLHPSSPFFPLPASTPTILHISTDNHTLPPDNTPLSLSLNTRCTPLQLQQQMDSASRYSGSPEGRNLLFTPETHFDACFPQIVGSSPAINITGYGLQHEQDDDYVHHNNKPQAGFLGVQQDPFSGLMASTYTPSNVEYPSSEHRSSVVSHASEEYGDSPTRYLIIGSLPAIPCHRLFAFFQVC